MTGHPCDRTDLLEDNFVTGQLCDGTALWQDTFVSGQLCDGTVVREDRTDKRSNQDGITLAAYETSSKLV